MKQEQFIYIRCNDDDHEAPPLLRLQREDDNADTNLTKGHSTILVCINLDIFVTNSECQSNVEANNITDPSVKLMSSDMIKVPQLSVDDDDRLLLLIDEGLLTRCDWQL